LLFGLFVSISIITTAMEIIRTSGAGTAGHTVALPCSHHVAQGGKQYGSGVVNHLNRALAGRSTHLGLSLIWLWSLGPCRGAADYPHRDAFHWANMKGAVIQPRDAPFYPTQTCTGHLWI
jgi:hypothetical protein